MLFQQAAHIQGRSLSDFLASSAEKAAHEVIQEKQVIQLSVEDSLSFARAVVDSTKPNSKLQSAYTRYRRNVSSK